MSFRPLHSAVWLLLSTFVLGLPATSTGQQQSPTELPPSPQPQQFNLKDYSRPQPAFPNVIAPYTPQPVPPPNLTDTSRIGQLIKDGKLFISLDDAIALALENNLDIAIARYNLNIADTDILRAKAGSSVLGVNAGIVQNTPGGGTGGLSGPVGSGSGGTSAGTGGAATGTSGLVSSTLGIGPPITSFDPIVTGTLQLDRNQFLSASAVANRLTAQNTGTANFGYQQGFASGTVMAVGFNNSRVSSSSTFATLSPSITSNFQFRVTQPLLQGLGLASNMRYLRIARNNREISDVAFRLQVITTVDQIENIYWDLVYAYENMKVQQEAVGSAQKVLEDNKKQVQFGTLPPIQVVSAESTVASDQQALIVAQTNLQLQELLMKNALSRNLDNPALADAEVIPTSVIKVPAQESVVPTKDLIADALAHRAELAESRIDLTTRALSNKAVRNAMLPTLDLFAYYGGSGLGGAQNPANICPAPPATLFGCHDAGTFQPVSYGATLADLVDSTAPDKGVGVTLTIPIRNRTAQANQVRAQLEYRQAQMRLQQLENQIRIEVRNAQFAVQQNRAAVRAAQAATDYARQTLEAEQKKLEVGVSTPTNVLQNQSALTTAQSSLVSAMAAYEKSRVELDRATGLLLDHTGIVLADAQRGQATHMPQAPYVAPRQDIQELEAIPQSAPQE
ncbi:MAG TPA: TolC family protein [Terriglobales bacterium]|nr:TolC family protein [Terriglobales bacterium]